MRHAGAIVCGCDWQRGVLVVKLGHVDSNCPFEYLEINDSGKLHAHALCWAVEEPHAKIPRIVHLHKSLEQDRVYGVDADGLLVEFRVDGDTVHIEGRPGTRAICPASSPGTGVTDMQFHVQLWERSGKAVVYRFSKTQMLMCPEGAVQRYFSPLLDGGAGSAVGGDCRVVAASSDMVGEEILAVCESGELCVVDLGEFACMRPTQKFYSTVLGVEWVRGLAYVFLCSEVVVVDVVVGTVVRRIVPDENFGISDQLPAYRPLARFNPILNFQRKLAQVPVNPAITESLLQGGMRERDSDVGTGFFVQGPPEGLLHVLNEGPNRLFYISCAGAWWKFHGDQWVGLEEPLPDDEWFVVGSWFCDGVRLFRERDSGWEEFGPKKILFSKFLGNSCTLSVSDYLWEFRFQDSVQTRVESIWTLPLPVSRICAVEQSGRMKFQSAIGTLLVDGDRAEWVDADVCLPETPTITIPDGNIATTDTRKWILSEWDVVSAVTCELTGETLMGARGGGLWSLAGTVCTRILETEHSPVEIVPLGSKFVVYTAEKCYLLEYDMYKARSIRPMHLGARIRHIRPGDTDDRFLCLLEPGTRVCIVHIDRAISTVSTFEHRMDFIPFGELLIHPGTVYTLGRFENRAFQTALVSINIDQTKIGGLFRSEAVNVTSVLPFDAESEEPVCLCLWHHRLFSTLIVVGTKGAIRGRLLLFDRATLAPISKTSVPSKQVSAVEPVSDLILAVGGAESVVIVGVEENALLYTIDVYQTYSQVSHISAVHDGILIVTANGALLLLIVSKTNTLVKTAVPGSQRHVVSTCIGLGDERHSHTFVCSTVDGKLLRYSVQMHIGELVLMEESRLGLHLKSAARRDNSGRTLVVVTEQGTLLNFPPGILPRESS